MGDKETSEELGQGFVLVFAGKYTSSKSQNFGLQMSKEEKIQKGSLNKEKCDF